MLRRPSGLQSEIFNLKSEINNLKSTIPQPDSRIFSSKATGIRLGSSQNVNCVLFSLACRKDSTAHKYFDLSHLHPGGRARENVVV
jgi:hypothetical protein